MSVEKHISRKRFEKLTAGRCGRQVREVHDAVQVMVDRLKRSQEAAAREKHREEKR